MIGLDAGVTKLATLSDGTIYEPVNSFKRNQRKLARLQRQLSRKVKFSANWQKQKRKIQHLHSHIANIRRDYLHKVSTTISKNHAMRVIEDLKVANMSKSAAGSISHPGRNVEAKSGLNRSILDQGWYELRRQLEYKQRWRGGQVLCLYKPALRLLRSYSERKPPITKSIRVPCMRIYGKCRYQRCS